MSTIKEKARIINAYKEMFQTEAGKLILEDLSRICHFKANLFTGDATRTVYNEGMRNVYLYINSVINVDPKAVEEMAKGQSED